VLVHDSDLMLRLVEATGQRILTWTVETATWNETPDIWELCCAVCFDLGDSTLLWEGTARWPREPAQLRRHLALTSNDLDIAADLRSGAVTHNIPTSGRARCRRRHTAAARPNE